MEVARDRVENNQKEAKERTKGTKDPKAANKIIPMVHIACHVREFKSVAAGGKVSVKMYAPMGAYIVAKFAGAITERFTTRKLPPAQSQICDLMVRRRVASHRQ